jgi:glutathione S-transferase
MKLFTSSRAPNPRRVSIFIEAKGITGIERVDIDLAAGEHRGADFLALNPFGRVPLLQLDDGRILAETRAICTYLEGLRPQPNLMGEDATERAFIEMADRRAEQQLFQTAANCVRHSHPGLAALEQPQFPAFGAVQGERMRAAARWFDQLLAGQPYLAGARFTIADITAFCGLEFARGLMKFRPGAEDMPRLQDWRERIAAMPCAAAPW